MVRFDVNSRWKGKSKRVSTCYSWVGANVASSEYKVRWWERQDNFLKWLSFHCRGDRLTEWHLFRHQGPKIKCQHCFFWAFELIATSDSQIYALQQGIKFFIFILFFFNHNMSPLRFSSSVMIVHVYASRFW